MPLTNLTSPISFYPSVCFRQNKVREGPPVCGFQHLLGWGNAELFPSELSPPQWPCSPHRTTRASTWLTHSFSGTWGSICNERSSLGPSFCKASWAAASGLDQVFYLCCGDIHTPPSRRLSAALSQNLGSKANAHSFTKLRPSTQSKNYQKRPPPPKTNLLRTIVIGFKTPPC